MAAMEMIASPEVMDKTDLMVKEVMISSLEATVAIPFGVATATIISRVARETTNCLAAVGRIHSIVVTKLQNVRISTLLRVIALAPQLFPVREAAYAVTVRSSRASSAMIGTRTMTMAVPVPVRSNPAGAAVGSPATARPFAGTVR